MCFKIKQNLYSILNLVEATMFCEVRFPFLSFITLVALEWSLHGMRLHVTLQMTRRSTRVVALVTFQRLFSCVHPHHVLFQMGRCEARILAHLASVWFLTRMCPLVLLQLAWFCCFIFTLIAMVQFFPGVPLDMCFEVGRMVAWKVALCAFVRFLPTVNEDVSLQMMILNKWLVAILATVFLDSTVDLLVLGKAPPPIP